MKVCGPSKYNKIGIFILSPSPRLNARRRPRSCPLSTTAEELHTLIDDQVTKSSLVTEEVLMSPGKKM